MTSIPAPEGSCDCHAHVFGPFDRYPLADDRAYTPPLSPVADYLAMLDAAGFSRGILVHGGANGWDQSAMRDALAAAPQRLRGVCVVPPDISDSDLADLHDAGVRGVRFTQTGGGAGSGRLTFDDLQAFAPRLRSLGWHAQLWATADNLLANADRLAGLGLPLVIDHMGYFDASRGVDDPAFQALLRMVGGGAAWVKLTMFRNSKAAPAYDDVRPFHDALVGANPERLVWGSDWPFLGMKGDDRPTTEALLAKLTAWLPSALQQLVLVDNPAKLYGFPEGGS